MGSEPTLPGCCFCGGTALTRTHAGVRHPFKPDHGPFDFHRCDQCGSGLTIAPPSREQLSALYGSFKDGLPDLHREITRDDPQNALYSLCIRRLRGMGFPLDAPGVSWIDVGAGGGELSSLIAEAMPQGRGTAMDLHERPALLRDAPRVEWRRVDLNGADFAAQLGLQADLVISTAVWEHVLHPDRYAKNLLRLLKPGGTLYLLCPDYGSLARKVMGRRWPYFTPGEHLNMPTARGALACLERQWRELHPAGGPPRTRAGSLALPYTFRYVFRRFGWDAIGTRIPARLGMPLPVGALESVLTAPAQ